VKDRKDYFSKSVDKGMRILALFDQSRPRLTLGEASRETGLNLTSTYRYVNTFLGLGYLTRDKQKRSLRLGPKAFVMGYRFLGGFDLPRIIKPIVDDIHNRYNISIDVALFHDDSLTVVYRKEAKDTLSFRLSLTTKAFHSTALGKAVLAYLPHDVRDRIIKQLPLEKRTKNTLTGRLALLHDLKTIRERGYSLNNEEYMLGLISIGAPILNSENGTVLGSISFDSNTINHSIRAFEKEFACLIKDVCKKVSDLISSA